jgi:ATP-binding cassette, subfamily A (ABC1), member 3
MIPPDVCPNHMFRLFRPLYSYICKEKELRQKELMKIMSVSESDINWSWFATFLLVHICTATFAMAVSSSLYERSEVLLLWIFWLLTLLSVIVFSMAIASLTSKTTRAVLFGLLLFLAGFVLSNVYSHEDRDKIVIQLISLHPIAAFSYGLNQIGLLEGDDVGLTSDSIKFSENKSGVSFQDILNLQLFDCVVWGILCFYFNRVIPQDYGQALPWYFPFSSDYWCPGRARRPKSELEVVDRIAESGIPYEFEGDALRRQAVDGKSVEIHGLRKVFGEKAAVDGLSLSMYTGQITALLGHNGKCSRLSSFHSHVTFASNAHALVSSGAGKTVTINILTGAMAPTEGYATVAGKDIRTDLQAIRNEMGICFQHDCLFPNLTVREHVQFFSRLKGLYSRMTRSEAEGQIDQSIRDVALFEKRNSKASILSGGMRRKLSVALAFCGNSKVVLLDEPTSGMVRITRVMDPSCVSTKKMKN